MGDFKAGDLGTLGRDLDLDLNFFGVLDLDLGGGGGVRLLDLLTGFGGGVLLLILEGRGDQLRDRPRTGERLFIVGRAGDRLGECLGY